LLIGSIRHETDPAFRAEIDKYGLGTDIEERLYHGQRGQEHDVISTVTDRFMMGMMWSDTKLRRWAASAALVNWENMEKLRKKMGDNMTERDMEPILFAGKAPKYMGLSDVEIAKNGPTLEEKYRVSDKRRMHGAVANDIYGMIQDGKMEQARDLYIRYVAEVSQWRYGRGGSSMLHRTPMKRVIFMFTQYPQNYLALQYMLYSNRMFGTMTKIVASQLVAASLFGAMGLKVGRWVMAGPLPNQVALGGPVGSLVGDVASYLHAGAGEAAAQLIPTMTQEESDRIDKDWEREQKRMEDILGL